MECVALGLPAITTDLSGFGAYVQQNVPEHRERGVHVLNRRTRSFDQSVEELVGHLLDFVKMSRRQRIEMRNRVERLSELFDWSAMIEHYNQAHAMALERGAANNPGATDARVV
jgi:glycogen(starch) synthase